jgi:hypothetical protein
LSGQTNSQVGWSSQPLHNLVASAKLFLELILRLRVNSSSAVKSYNTDKSSSAFLSRIHCSYRGKALKWS